MRRTFAVAVAVGFLSAGACSPGDVFRNAAGEIVGGADDYLSGGVVPGGSSGGVYSNHPVPGVDDSRTAVYV